MSSFREQLVKMVELQRAEMEISSLEKDLAGIDERIEALNTEVTDFESNVNDALEKLSDLKKQYRSDESEIQLIDTQIGKSEEKLRAVKTNKEYQYTLKEIEELKEKTSGIEDIMLENLEQIENADVEVVEQKADLEEAIATLRNGIASLNKEGRERLLTAFEQVNSNFGLLFRHLFGGGEANLVLVESEDPLEAGLEIMCQPPGKKLSTLSLLSGGEQTLTAMALIFAVFLANPAPICVLDEVDAPLDDANIDRFLNLLRKFSDRTQFIVVTHNKRTMEVAGHLYGVTMEESGVSKLVSVAFDDVPEDLNDQAQARSAS